VDIWYKTGDHFRIHIHGKSRLKVVGKRISNHCHLWVIFKICENYEGAFRSLAEILIKFVVNLFTAFEVPERATLILKFFKLMSENLKQKIFKVILCCSPIKSRGAFGNLC
jgi:hypothetical protein